MTDQNSLELKVQHDGNGVYFRVDSPDKHPNLWLIVEKFSNLDSRSGSFRRFGTPISWMESSHIHHPTTSLRIWRCYNHHTWKLSSTIFLAPTDPGLYFSATFHASQLNPPKQKQVLETSFHFKNFSLQVIPLIFSRPSFFVEVPTGLVVVLDPLVFSMRLANLTHVTSSVVNTKTSTATISTLVGWQKVDKLDPPKRNLRKNDSYKLYVAI